MSNKLRLQREQLYKFIGDDPEAVRAFEQAFESINNLLPLIEDVNNLLPFLDDPLVIPAQTDFSTMPTVAGVPIAPSERPAFMAYSTVGGTYTTGQVLPWTDTSLNVGNCFSTVTNRFTAPVSGLYQFHCGVLVLSGSSDARWWINGVNTGYAIYGNRNATTNSKGFGEILTLMSAGDYIDIRAQGVLPMYPDTSVHRHNQFLGMLIDAS